MIKTHRKIYSFYLLVDLFLVSITFFISYFLRHKNNIYLDAFFPHFKEYTFIFALWFIFIVVFFKRRELYSTDRGLTIPKEGFMVIVSIIYASLLMGAVIFFAQYKFFSRQIFSASFFLLCLFLGGWRIMKRLALRRLIQDGFHNVNILIVGVGNVEKIVMEEIKRNPFWGFRVVGILDDEAEKSGNGVPVLGRLSDFARVAKKYFIDEVVIAISSNKKAVSEIIKQAKEMHLGVRIVPENFEEPLPDLSISYLGVVPLITYKERMRHPAELALKRFFDFFISLFLLIILSPLFLIIALLIKSDSSGPVFYIQKRAGHKGRLFNFYKFRSMGKGAERLKSELLSKNEVKDGVLFKMKKDPRITSLGRFLRKYSLDELPQLFNVLKGDMSLVGPRPPTPDEVEKYNHIHMQRLSIRPGLTGLSQVRGRSELTFRRWVKWDAWYMNNWSFGLDLRILLWTIPTVLRSKGAY